MFIISYAYHQTSQSVYACTINLSPLDDRSRDIVEQRWLTEQKSTLHELAAIYSISAERVRQIEKNAMDKIREAMTIESVILPDDIQ